ESGGTLSERQLLEKGRKEPGTRFLFASEGRIRDTTKLLSLLEREALVSNIEGLSVFVWRHADTAIWREKFKKRGERNVCLDEDLSDSEPEGPESTRGISYESLIETFHYLAGHSSKTANLHYGKTVNLGKAFGDDLLLREFTACLAWHAYFGFDIR